MNDHLPDPIFAEAEMHNNGGATYNDILQGLVFQYQLNNDDLIVLTHPEYTRKYVFRDAQLFCFLRQTESLQAWIVPLYHILILPNNALRDLNLEDLKSIFQNLTPPTSLDDLAALFGGMTL